MRVRSQVVVATVLLWCCAAAQAERYTVPLFVAPGAGGDPQGVLRVVNDADAAATVSILAVDDAGVRTGPATLTLNAASAVQLSATELQSANAPKGLASGLGSLAGHVRLVLDSDLPVVPSAYVRAADGTLSAMHDTVRAASIDTSGRYRYDVPVFNPSTEVTQVSRLRLINPGDATAAVTIGARDDGGAEATGGDVTLTLAPRGAKTLTAQQLETGDTDITGRLGAGTGKWRLTVSSDRPLQVVNVVASDAGYWNNLSTTAVPGSAPVDTEAFGMRFAGGAIVYEGRAYRGGAYDSRLRVQPDGRFTETWVYDGAEATYTGGWGFEAIGTDAGRFTLTYSGGDECRGHLYFGSPTAGWLTWHCTGGNNPDRYWLGGNWSVEDDDGDGDGGGDVTDTTYGVDEALPGVPTSGSFIPSRSGGGIEFLASGAGTTINMNTGAYFELIDGTRYTCTSAGGCTVANGTITRGSMTGPASGSGGGEVDRFPSFRGAAAPGNQSYTVGTAIDTLTLPEASGGNGDLTYSLSPSVPGLTFNPTTRRLTGTPSTIGSLAMMYTSTDEDGDTDTLRFTITVSAGTSTEGTLGACQVGMTLSSGQSCTYPGTTDEFSVNARGRGSFLDRLAGIRLRFDNETINGRVYDFEASHQGDGLWRIDRLAGSTVPPTNGGGTGTGTDTSPTFAAGAGPGNRTYTVGTAIDALRLPEASGGDGTLFYRLSPEVPGLTFNPTNRRLSGTPTMTGSHDMTYTVTDEDGDTDTIRFMIAVEELDDSGNGSIADSFDLDADSSDPRGIAFANGRFYVVDRPQGTLAGKAKVYAYSSSGQRDAAADFDLHADNGTPFGITYTNGRFYVVDWADDKVYAYSSTGQRDAAADFELYEGNGDSRGITHADGRLYIVDSQDDKVYVYSITGQHDAASDFALREDNGDSKGIAYANGRFYIVNENDYSHLGVAGKIHAYAGPALSDGPDLRVEASASKLALSASESLTISAVVLNDGNQPSAATTLRYYRSADSTISTADTEVGTDTVSGLAASGGTSEESISLTVPADAGVYYYGACADRVTGESDIGNNCSDSVTISVGLLADLEVSRAELHYPLFIAFVGDAISMTVDVTNNGPGASGPAIVRFSGESSFTVDIPALAPDETTTLERQRVGSVRFGTVRSRACVESTLDPNPDNNCRSDSATFN